MKYAFTIWIFVCDVFHMPLGRAKLFMLELLLWSFRACREAARERGGITFDTAGTIAGYQDRNHLQARECAPSKHPESVLGLDRKSVRIASGLPNVMGHRACPVTVRHIQSS
jgi:hypothetical protein